MAKHVINIDWLAFSVRLANSAIVDYGADIEFAEPPGCKLFEATPTNMYKRRVIVYKDGAKLLTLLADPYSKIIKRDCVLVEVANQCLYGDLSWVMPLLYNIAPCTMVGFSRLDICADFERKGKAGDIINGLRKEDIYVMGKRDGSMFFSADYGEKVNRSPHCYSWGSKHSSIKWKLYNKSLEIMEIAKLGDGTETRICNKPYIQDMWRENGFDVDNMWRLEVSITDANKYRFEGKTLEWELCQSRDLFEELFNSLYMTRFQTRKNQGHKDRRNDEQVWLLGEKPVVDRVRIREPKNTQTIVEYANGLNYAMKQLQQPEVIMNIAAQDVWLRTLQDIADVGKLRPYFYETYGTTLENFVNIYQNR